MGGSSALHMGSMDCRALGRGPALDQCELAPLWMLSGRFQEAEDEFVKAGKPREAIDMWCHQQDWAAALSVAERCDPQSVPDILAAQASLAATAGPEQETASAANLTVACASIILHLVAAVLCNLRFRQTGRWLAHHIVPAFGGRLLLRQQSVIAADDHTHPPGHLQICCGILKGLPQRLSHSALGRASCSNRHACLGV